MNADAFSKMMPTSYLINTARGPIVHEIALTDALQAGKLAGCALDVFEFEPLPVDSPLRSMDNVRNCTAPHCTSFGAHLLATPVVTILSRFLSPNSHSHYHVRSRVASLTRVAAFPLQVLIAPHNSNSSPTAHENVQWNTIRNLMIGLGIPYEDYDAEI